MDRVFLAGSVGPGLRHLGTRAALSIAFGYGKSGLEPRVAKLTC